MDVGAASAISSYSYATARQSGTQAQSVLQTLTQAYSSASTANAGLDPLSAMVGRVNLRPLVSAIYDQSQSGQAGAALPGLDSAQQTGGLNSDSASALLATLGSSSGFDGALNASAYLALAAYQGQQTATVNPQPPAADASPATQNSYMQQLFQAAQSASTTATFNLLG